MLGLRKGSWRYLALAVILGTPLSLRAQASSAGQYFAAANQLYTSKNYNQAIQYYTAVVKSNPNYAPAFQGIGNCYYALGNKPYALAYYKKAYQLSPSAQLGQFIQTLQGQTAGAGMGLQAAVQPQTNSYLATGMKYFQAKQYAAAIPYFKQATRQIPNDYRPFYYLGYCYYMANQQKYGALYIGVAAMKQPNASISATETRIKGNLSDDDAQWVDDQLSKYASTTGLKLPPVKTKPVFGFDMGLGMDYLLSDPTQIEGDVTAKGTVALTGVTPSLLAMPSFNFFVQLSPSFEIDLGGTYLPIGSLTYTWKEYDSTDQYTSVYETDGNYYKLNYTTSIFTGSLGMKVLFGDSTMKGYFGAGADISPISMTFQKTITHETTGIVVGGEDPASSDVSGDYSTVAFGGHAVLGADFILGKGIGLGPYIGFKYLDATNFKNKAGNLVVNTFNGDVGNSGQGLWSTYPTTNLDLDFSGIYGGLNVAFSF